MTRQRLILGWLFVALMTPAAFTQQRQNANKTYPPKFEDARTEVYKTVGDVKLNLYLFHPEGHQASDSRPAIVFFFGGGWRGGSPAQFQQQCRHLAERGMVAITADYRVASRHQTKAVKCVSDGKSAIRWVRQNAQRLGIDPNKIAAGGGSAGGHVAACTGVLEGFDEAGEDTSISSRPNAMVLFNPALVLAPTEANQNIDEKRLAQLKERMGVEPKQLSPYHQVTKGVPPTLILHGTGDTTVPFATAKLFTEKMKSMDNACQLVGFEDRPHGFFNYGKRDNQDYLATVNAMDDFLVKQGFLKPAKK